MRRPVFEMNSGHHLSSSVRQSLIDRRPPKTTALRKAHFIYYAIDAPRIWANYPAKMVREWQLDVFNGKRNASLLAIIICRQKFMIAN